MDVEQEPRSPEHSGLAHGRPRTLIALTVILFIEAALLAASTLWLAFELVTEVPSSYTTAVAVLVVALLAAVWVTVLAVGALRARGWVRGGAIMWQLLQLAIAVGCFQGLYAQPGIGWALLVPAVVAIVLAVTPSVRAATARS